MITLMSRLNCYCRFDSIHMVKRIAPDRCLTIHNIIIHFDLVLQEVGRVKFELFADQVPKTAENIR